MAGVNRMAGEDTSFADLGFLYRTATGIGSMPHTDADAALRLISQTLPQGPHWPQLPKRGREEGFIRQHLRLLEKMELLQTAEDPPFFYDREDDWPARLERFYNLCLQAEEEKDGGEALRFFALPPDSAGGFYSFIREGWFSRVPVPRYIKGQISGPLSLGLQVNAADQTAAFYRPELREIITRTLALSIRRQVRDLKRFSLPVLIFIDEPALLSYGQSAFVSLSRAEIKACLGEIVAAITAEGAYAGVHCCSGVDWSILFELPLHVVNFDAYNYFTSILVYSAALESFLQRGGCLAWGLVPTSPEVETEDGASLLRRFNQGIERLANKGVTERRLREQYLLTPSCGTATLSTAQAERVYGLTADLRERLARKSGK
ncbi:MAG: hypothetical protein AB1796_12155 [Bacillota bacterium]